MESYKLEINDLVPRTDDLKGVKENLLGRGSYGVVYRAVYKKSMNVAVKTIHDDIMEEDGGKEEIQQECATMIQLHHTNLARLYGFNVTKGAACLVMELAEHGSLYDILKNKKKYLDLTWQRRLSISRDIIYGLIYLHDRKNPILHRDLKSLNVLIRENWKAFIADFGLARIKLTSRTVGTKGIGSFPWMSPEMQDPDAISTPAVDIFSFGMILYELLTREVPFGIEKLQPAQVISAVNRGKRPTLVLEESKYESIKDCPSGYIELMKECWDQDPSKRPKATSILDRLEGFLKASGDESKDDKSEQESFSSTFSSSTSSSSSSSASLQWTPAGVRNWLHGAGFGDHLQNFENSQIDAEMLMSLVQGSPAGLMIKDNLPLFLECLKMQEASFSSSSSLYSSSSHASSSSLQSLQLKWEGFCIQSFHLSFQPNAMIFNSQQTQLILSTSNSIDSYSFDGQEIKDQSLIIEYPTGVSLDTENNYLYVVHQTHLTIFNLTKNNEKITSWPLSLNPNGNEHHLAIDNNIVYLTTIKHHQIFLYTKEGKFIQTFGTEKSGQNQCEFNNPNGIITDKKHLYICDWGNHRIQVLDKKNGTFFTQWGKEGTKPGEFICPISIYLPREEGTEGLVYVGDSMSVQIFQKINKICLQRLGDIKSGGNKNQFQYVRDIRIYNEQLYVCDQWNSRIQIFQKQRVSAITSIWSNLYSFFNRRG